MKAELVEVLIDADEDGENDQGLVAGRHRGVIGLSDSCRSFGSLCHCCDVVTLGQGIPSSPSMIIIDC